VPWWGATGSPTTGVTPASIESWVPNQ